ncbi:hypothetical protein D9757_015107 [Collybiopsis confluens]|uniref:Ubiquitin-like protease family profile domain-containing protein n=1 Tax=Collybiopsis confluens TaxID=2823264 RepID=A0A8H5FJI5_9AGAR|nr:hypothetical protein D9757_015107 [Collybiopsis confluens]
MWRSKSYGACLRPLFPVEARPLPYPLIQMFNPLLLHPIMSTAAASNSSSTRTMYKHLLSPSRRQAITHKRCTFVDFPPFGLILSCTSPLFLQLSNTINQCSAFVPSISLQRLLRPASICRITALLNTDFSPPALSLDDGLYLESETRIKRLCEVTKVLSKVVQFQSTLAFYQRKHGDLLSDALPSDNSFLIVVQNLEILSQCINSKREAIEASLWTILDDHPEQSESILRILVKKLSDDPNSINGKLPFVTLANLRTLSAGRWLDDEVVNYFVKKWCTQSGSTLGFNTFFACKILFQEPECINAREGFFTDADENTVRRWCAKAAVSLDTEWDSVFIPINESSTHWYSARIDFRVKRIDIFDSLRDRCIENRQKPLLERKNSKLMLVLMWLTDVLGRIRGEDTMLKNNPESDWVCDPHYKVHFQANSYDCGVHMLWHLRHLLEFRQVRVGAQCSSGHLRFNDSMAGKRLRLAQEMLTDAGLL